MMARLGIHLVSCLLIAVALAGCFGGEDDPVPGDGGDEPPVATTTDETGAVSGTLVTNQLEPVAAASVGLIRDGDTVAGTTTDQGGRFAISELEPGVYRLQVAAVCCKAKLADITVEAGAVTEANLQLDVLSSDDLQVPYQTREEWAGMISCAVAGVALCGIQGDFDESLEDPNDRFMTDFYVGKGIKSLVIGVEWKATGGTAGKGLNLLVEDNGCGGLGCNYTYADISGESPLEVRIDNDDITEADYKWDAIESQRQIQFRVFPAERTDVMYQQAFTVYYDVFYWDEAPEDYSALPDG